MRVLVGYASARGSTRGVAERIASDLTDRGFAVDCRPIADVHDVAGYDAVVAGSAIHGQAWMSAAARFLSTHAAELSGLPLWLFSVGMPGALARPLRRLAMREGPKAVAPFAALHPRGAPLFSGVVSRQDFPLRSRIVLRAMGGHYGDFRDWDAIDAWTGRIADELDVIALRGVS